MEGMHDTVLEGENRAPELGITHPFSRFSLSDKPGVSKLFEDLRSFENSLILCIFTSRALGENYRYPLIRSLLENATGIGLSAADMLRVGERNYALLRLHAARTGYTADQDSLPDRFFTPLKRGASAEWPIDHALFDEALAEYRRRRGYDAFGPTESTLKQLGLEEVGGIMAQSGGRPPQDETA
jgi:aldehyde:ferredoxin oxidoreductase